MTKPVLLPADGVLQMIKTEDKKTLSSMKMRAGDGVCRPGPVVIGSCRAGIVLISFLSQWEQNLIS